MRRVFIYFFTLFVRCFRPTDLSTTLFNTTVAPFLWKLQKIPDLKATAYPDDIAIWTFKGKKHYQRQTMQLGLDAIGDFLREVDMIPSPEKTKYTIFGRGHEDSTLQMKFAGVHILANRKSNSYRSLLGTGRTFRTNG